MSSMKLIMALAIGFLVSSAVGAFLVPWLRKVKAGQEIKSEVTWHQSKSGTPTMGGLMFIAAIAVVCFTVGFGFVLEGQWGHVLVLSFGLVFGAIGFLDDYEKLRHHENKGLTAKGKFLLQLAASVCFLFLLRRLGYLDSHLYVPFRNVVWDVPDWFYFPFASFVIVGTVNAVNLTDGVDGLAGGTCTAVFIGFTAIAWSWGQEYMSLGMFSAGMTGALLGFLIYNFNPAKVFMGDTGSLFLGGCISGMAFAMDAPLILVPLCIMPIIETLSDIIQVTYFKLTHGKRIFKMAPFHHHLEMGGWTGKKWKEKEIFTLFTGVTLLMAVASVLGAMHRFGA